MFLGHKSHIFEIDNTQQYIHKPPSSIDYRHTVYNLIKDETINVDDYENNAIHYYLPNTYYECKY